LLSKRCKIMVWVVLTLFMVSLGPSIALADSSPGISLEEAIKIVKNTFEVPQEFQEFSSGFANYDKRQIWHLNWNALQEPGSQGGSFNAQVDAQSGEIISMSHWQPGSPDKKQDAKISPSEAREAAVAFLNQVAPQRVAFLKEMPDNQIMELSPYGPGTYQVRWQRMEKQIPVEGDGAVVQINLSDGQVRSYNLNWSQAEMPDPTGIISQEKAQQSFKDAGMLELQYLLNSGFRPLASNSDENKVALVYRLVHKSYGVIDAMTGEPRESGRQYLNEKEMAVKRSADQAAIPLTPEEEREIGTTANLLTQEQAAAAVHKWIKAPEGAVLNSANLEKDWQDPNLRIWNLHWSSQKDDSYSYLWAQVNAATGEVLSFSLGYPQSDKAKYTLDREGARRIAEAFLKQIQPERFTQVSLEAEQESEAVEPYEGPNWSLQWTRLVNGIKCPGNGFNVSVDRHTRQVLSYSLNLSEKEFPSPDGVLSMDEAEQAFLKHTPLTLIYSPVYGRDRVESYQLVYAPQDPNQRISSQIMDAFNGEPLDWQGKPWSEQPQAYSFDDIAGHFAEKEINMIGKAGFMGEYGISFHPQENVSAASLFRVLIGTRNGLYSVQNYSDEEILILARNMGWLKETIASDAAVSRELLAKVVIRSLGLDYLAEVPGIYRYPYQDQVDPVLQGYATLCWGLGIIKADGKSFSPGKQISRAEAAVIAVRLLGQINR
jgi:hypothetical protein